MELRTLVLIFAMPLGCATASPVQRYPLDDRAVYSVRIGTGAPTTVTFPGAITAIEGASLSTKPDDQPPVLVSHHADSAFFSVRALRPDATAAANVVFRGKIFAFTFTAAEAPDRAITFYEEGEGKSVAGTQRLSVVRLFSLLDRAKNFSALAEQYPALTQHIAHTTPNTSTVGGALTCTVEAVFGFADEDAIVLRVRLENRGTSSIRYAPARLAVLVGATRHPVTISDASGELPAGHAEVLHLALIVQFDGTPAHLSVKNTFALALPLPE